MSKLTLYNGLKADLEAVTSTRGSGKTMRFKLVQLWRNNLEHLDRKNNDEQPILFPACFIEFMPSNYLEVGQKAQEYDLTVRLHICFESYKDEDVDVLALVESTFAAIHYKQYGNFGKMKRRDEIEDFDHDNVQDYIQEYSVGKAMDYAAMNQQRAPIDNFDVNGELIQP